MSSIFNLFRSSSASDFSLPYARKTADWNIVLWLLVPAWLLFWLWTNPPHGFDLAFEHQFYVNNAWPLHADGRIEFWLHFMPKVISGVLFACVLGALTYLHQCRRAAVILGDHEDAAHCNLILSRLYYAVGAALLCVGLLWWLKQSTGVSCPWSVTEFGGSAAVVDPGLPFLPKPGRCWPSGAAGSGFCLLPLYFAFRDFRPRLARLLLALALLSGFGAGFARVVVGAHFPSHVFAALALDWLISAGIYIAAFDRAGLVRKLRALLPFGRRSTEDQPGRVTLYLFTSLWWAIVFNGPMTAKLAIDNNLVTTDSLILSLGTTAAFAFVSAAIIELCGLLPKMVFRILLLILNTLGAAAFAAAYLYGTAMTPDMVRNFLATDPAEAQAYLSTRSVLLFLAAWLPPMLVTLAANLKRSAWAARPTLLRSLLVFLRRLFTSIGFAAVGVALIGLNFQAFAGAMRNDKSLRYMIAPVNVVYSDMRTIVGDSSPETNAPRVAVDPSPSLAVKPSRPAVLVVMVGETTRSASWQLAGYSRETNPQLSELQIISIPRVEACGTSTDVSLPCMMSRIGRSDYNRDRILSEEQLPSLLNRAGANVLWIDNQSGCKGACTGVSSRATTPNPQDCPNGECGDRVFLSELKGELGKLPADRPTVLFLHMMGSHGPAYSLRSDKARKLFEPECTDADLKSCSRESVMNAYDNSVRETDYVLASLIRMLKDTSGSIDSALVYVSDHGESLGEGGLYLHGAPYWMAPKEQTEVPMVLWMNSGFEKTFSINRSKLEKNAAGRVTHENLYHTVLGLLNVKSTTYVPTYDLTH